MSKEIGINDTEPGVDQPKESGSVRYLNSLRDVVSHLEAQSNYTLIHFTNGKKPVMSAQTLGDVLVGITWLVRIHKSYAINPTLITTVMRHAGTRLHSVKLNTDVVLPISRLDFKAVLSIIQELGIEFEYIKRYSDPV